MAATVLIQHPPILDDFVSSLPGDPDTSNHRRQVVSACYSWVNPTRFPRARLLCWSQEMAEELQLSPATLGQERFTEVFSGNRLLEGMRPYASCYGGHQFGHWAGQLGDGRAITLGEMRGRSGQLFELQLKGAGPTPYSRTADGLAVLRSSIREFLCSEAMHALGIPTTRALSLVETGEQVTRDMFYDGHPHDEPGAIVCRVAPSFLRFGNFEIHAARNEIAILEQLADFCIARHFPDLDRAAPDRHLRWFEQVCQRTAVLITEWMRVGFVHGVMNTDNMSILGLSIDYGPYGWLEPYDPNWTPNTTDAQGRRYAFGRQPQMALWNLVQLANALYPLVREVEPLEQALEDYKSAYEKRWLDMMRRKLGLRQEQADDAALIDTLLQQLQRSEVDMTLFFRRLAAPFDETPLTTLPQALRDCSYQMEAGTYVETGLKQWLQRYQERLRQETSTVEERTVLMHAVNPLYVPRNYLVQMAIDDAYQGDLRKLQELHEVFKQPYTEQPGKEHLAAMRPEWARYKAGCSMLSCSS
ncbi:MAG TPA: YdiU family protein [Hyphomicrobiales bacterium]|nr:YdiU family protein [Hyphomicrobiales bacterium]